MVAGGRNSGFVEEPLLASRGSVRVVGEEEGRVSGEKPEAGSQHSLRWCRIQYRILCACVVEALRRKGGVGRHTSGVVLVLRAIFEVVKRPFFGRRGSIRGMERASGRVRSVFF